MNDLHPDSSHVRDALGHMSPALCGTYSSGSQATRPHHSGSPRVALVTSRREDPVQTALLLVHKSLLGHTPEYISYFLTPVADILARSALRASSCGNLVIPWTCRRIGDRAFSVAPCAWNRLPTDLKLLRSTDSLCRKLKTLLFGCVFGHREHADLFCDSPSVYQ